MEERNYKLEKTCLSSVIEHTDQEKVGEEKFLYLTGHTPSLREVGAGSPGRTLRWDLR